MGQAEKFAGRPGKKCTRCRSIWHWVNTMGGVSCWVCSPPTLAQLERFTASDGTDSIESRWIVADIETGKWELPDGFLHIRPPEPGAAEPNTSRDQTSRDQLAGSGGQSQTIQDAHGGAGEPTNWDSIVLGAFDAVGESGSDFRSGRWSIKDQEMVDWFLATIEGDGLGRFCSMLNGQRLTLWYAIADAAGLARSLKEDCRLGPEGPRAAYGVLVSELDRLRDFLEPVGLIEF